MVTKSSFLGSPGPAVPRPIGFEAAGRVLLHGISAALPRTLIFGAFFLLPAPPASFLKWGGTYDPGPEKVARLHAMGYANGRGRPYSASCIKSMVEGPMPQIAERSARP
jgi:hypothetical protein